MIITPRQFGKFSTDTNKANLEEYLHEMSILLHVSFRNIGWDGPPVYCTVHTAVVRLLTHTQTHTTKR